MPLDAFTPYPNPETPTAKSCSRGFLDRRPPEPYADQAHASRPLQGIDQPPAV